MVAEGLMGQMESHQLAERPKCEQCGQPMENKGQKGKTVVTRLGEVRVKRAYYWCPGYRRVIFPLDNKSGIWDGGRSEGVVKLAVSVAGRNSYREAEETLSRVGSIRMSANRIWHYTNQWAERLCESQAKAVEQAHAMPSREEPQRGEARYDRRMGFSLDGWMINLIGEGWKEVKARVIYQVSMEVGQDALTSEAIELPQAKQDTYIAHLGGPEEFGRKFWAEALRRDLPAAYDKACVSDAAAWIWNLCQDYVPEAVQIVDWYHACQHLYTAANLLYGEGTEPGPSVGQGYQDRPLPRSRR